MTALYQHQIIGADWLSSRLPNVRGQITGYLADVPGTGKSRTGIAAINRVRASRPLVVCPAIVRSHWVREFDTCGFDAEQPIVKSYDEIVRGGLSLMKRLVLVEKIDALVLDEAHMLKHEESQRTQFLLGPNGYARRVPVAYALSGTPIPKNPMEFWPVLSSLFPDVALKHGLKRASDMQDKFAVVRTSWVRGQMRDKVMPTIRNEDEFREILAAVMLRRTLDDVGIDVPTLDWQTMRLDGDTLDTYEDGLSVRHALDIGESLADIEKDPHVTRMRRRLGMLKVGPVATMLKALLAESDEKVCVFAHHLDVLKELHQQIAGRNLSVAYIDGSTSQAKRDRAIERFAVDEHCRVFLGQNIACGTGTDGLQKSGARRAFLVEPDWTAANNEQLGKRLARIGGAGRVVATMIALAGTLDEAIVNQNMREVQMADSVGLGNA